MYNSLDMSFSKSNILSMKTNDVLMDVKSPPEDVIIISSDEEDDSGSCIFVEETKVLQNFTGPFVEESSLVCISDDEELPDLPINYKALVPKKEKEDFSDIQYAVTETMIETRKEDKVVINFPSHVVEESSLLCISDDEELPDLPINYKALVPKKEKEDFPYMQYAVTEAIIETRKENKAVNFSSHFEAVIPKKEVQDRETENDKSGIIVPKQETRISPDLFYEPPNKILKFEIDDSDTNKWKQEFVSLIRKSMCTSLLRGCIKGIAYSTWKDHNHQVMTSMTSQNLLETMLAGADDHLQSFALRCMCKAVTSNHYLAPVIVEKLLVFLVGSDEKMEISPLDDFYLGVSTLQKQLLFHHPCRHSMKQYYLKMCSVYWPLLISKVQLLLTSEEPQPYPVHSPNVKPAPSPKDTMPAEDGSLYDFTEIMRKKEDAKKKRFLNISRTEKLNRMNALLKYFVDLFHSDTQTWFLKYWRGNIPAFSTHIKPILYKITWKDTLDIGHLNQSVKLIFDLYCESAEESCFHRLFGIIVGLYATIIHRSEKSVYPEMDNLTREYALELYKRIKSSAHLAVHLADLQPDWLKFLVVASFLRVDESPNFYKLKEKIVRILEAKDRYGVVDYDFDVETVCLHGLHAMAGMLGVHPSMGNTCDLSDEVMEDDFKNVWFRENLQQQDIVNNVKVLKSLINTECVQRRERFHCYGFEDDIRKM